MIQFLLKEREGQFLLLGTLFLILGFAFGFNPLLSRICFYIAIFFLGFFAAKNAIVETVKDRSPNVDLLMILAALGAVLINYESEGAMLLFIFAGAEVLEDYATNKSTNAIEALLEHVPDTALLLLDNGETVKVSTSELKIGQTVVVAKGAQVPIDGVIDRHTIINEAALTGESVPVEKHPSNEVYAGTINEGNAFHLTVNKTSDQTVFSNIIRMVEEAQGRPSKIASFIDRIESRYVIIVLIAVPIFIIALMVFNQMPFSDAFYRGMVLLTVASPCALVASATPATLSAISNGANNGVLFKGGAAMEALSTMDILFSDKTGTLTKGEFEVINYQIEEDYLAEVIYMEQQSSHPIAEAITHSFPEVDLSNVNMTEPVEEVAGTGVKKGSLIVGKPSYFENYANPNNYQPDDGETVIFVGKDNTIIGYFSLADQIRQEAKRAVTNFKNSGVDVQLITGDNEKTAKIVANELGIEHYHANCLPEDKINFVIDYQSNDQVVGMIGDGINDAPALANAEIGIAMGSGSSVAMESADVVIVKNDLNKLYYSYELSNRLNRIIKQNVTFAVGVIIILIALNLLGWLDLPTGVIFHEGSTILVILNGLRLLSNKDEGEKVTPSGSPEHALN
ncbi:heavy metal translocating P-type ATPase [Fundicoccus culcitae]|uniref:Heavy metal translocating P-type ATPase n=1 Tax=Fundicoccus culcitae TaxID=2969821 RepID=A0ABY5P8I8_9LACT|nr:heavy metal translocating P-type ATPase [Fundicoccus culcitae]UUX35061.1 heavy metal translocating P-type ATPase [Fundicoccus culcitae]